MCMAKYVSSCIIIRILGTPPKSGCKVRHCLRIATGPANPKDTASLLSKPKDKKDPSEVKKERQHAREGCTNVDPKNGFHSACFRPENADRNGKVECCATRMCSLGTEATGGNPPRAFSKILVTSPRETHSASGVTNVRHAGCEKIFLDRGAGGESDFPLAAARKIHRPVPQHMVLTQNFGSIFQLRKI